jgi:HD-GYP domain-containing protein (c-di-GMP phosphodiesterase class II)
MLQRLATTSVDLFVQYSPQREPTLYHRARQPFRSGHLRRLAEAGMQYVFVRAGDFQAFSDNLLESLQALVEHETVSHAEQYAALQMAFAMEIERTTHLLDCGPYVELATNVARKFTALVADDEVRARDLFRLARHDFYTFTHVTNVCGYAVILARRLGIGEFEKLESIATGAMLHDIGKRFIPARLLSKPTRLDSAERALIETHPQRGYEELCRRPTVSFEQLMMVYQHHERLDGSGYPVGLVGSEIHPWAKILAVVDVFDAMTGLRPYRRSASVRDTLDYMARNVGTHFDPEVAQCWRSALITN